MGCRIVAWAWGSDSRITVWSILLLSGDAGFATALGEASPYWVKLGINPSEVLAADLTLDTGFRPAWAVLAITLAVTAAGALRAINWGWHLRPT